MATACKTWTRIGTCLSDPLKTFTKAPNDAKTYRIDASSFLQSGDTLTATFTITAPPPLMVGDGTTHPAPSNTNTQIIMKLYAGAKGHEYAVNVEFTTAQGETHTASFLMRIAY